MPPKNLTYLARLAQLARKLNARQFGALSARDPVTGAFKTGSAITGKSLRAAWGIPARAVDPRREAFRKQLLAAIRAPRT